MTIPDLPMKRRRLRAQFRFAAPLLRLDLFLFVLLMLFKLALFDRLVHVPYMDMNRDDRMVAIGTLALVSFWTLWLPRRGRLLALIALERRAHGRRVLRSRLFPVLSGPRYGARPAAGRAGRGAGRQHPRAVVPARSLVRRGLAAPAAVRLLRASSASASAARVCPDNQLTRDPARRGPGRSCAGCCSAGPRSPSASRSCSSGPQGPRHLGVGAVHRQLVEHVPLQRDRRARFPRV